MTQPNHLPSAFTSIYRIFLRTCSASVLHQKNATSKLRLLYRPLFDDGAQVVKQIQQAPQDGLEQARQQWMKRWDERVDNTLALLYVACKSRGLPHKLTRNLGYFVLSEQQRLQQLEREYKTWNPHLSQYTGRSLESKSEDKKKKQSAFDSSAWLALSEVVNLAEGRDNVSLGRICLNRRKVMRSRRLR